MHPSFLRRALAATALAAIGIAAVGLAASPAAQAQSVLKVLIDGNVTTVDPVVTTESMAIQHGFMVYDQLFALDAQTGKELWNSGKQITKWNHWSGLAVANGRIYINTFDGELYCFGLQQ